MVVDELVMCADWAATVVAILVAARLRTRLVRRAALVAEAAHELRGPLTAAGLALHGAGGDPSRLAAAELELRRARLAVDDLTAAPSGRRVAAALDHMDVRAVAGEVVAAARPVAARFGATVRLELSGAAARVRADRLRLAQALANLVVNAAEHGGGDVVVRVASSAQRVRIEIRDGGPGPAPAVLAAAARRARLRGAVGLPSAARGTRGHGLAIAARVAAEHGGVLLATGSAGVVLELPHDERRDLGSRPDMPRRAGGFVREDGAGRWRSTWSGPSRRTWRPGSRPEGGPRGRSWLR